MKTSELRQRAEKAKERIGIGVICLILAIIIAGGLGTMWAKGIPEVKTHEVPVHNEIENAVIVSRLDNEVSFKDMQFGFLSGAGAGGLGMGTSQVVCKSAEQFLAFVPEGEPIYVAFQKSIDAAGNIIDGYSINRVYWAFVENRSGVWIYEDIYTYQEGQSSFRVKDYNDQRIVFVDPVEESRVSGQKAWSIVGSILCLILLFVGFGMLIPNTWFLLRHRKRL